MHISIDEVRLSSVMTNYFYFWKSNTYDVYYLFLCVDAHRSRKKIICAIKCPRQLVSLSWRVIHIVCVILRGVQKIEFLFFNRMRFISISRNGSEWIVWIWTSCWDHQHLKFLDIMLHSLFVFTRITLGICYYFWSSINTIPW